MKVDIVSYNDELSQAKAVLYRRLLDFLYDVKIVQGGTDLYHTLRRHKNVNKFLLEEQVKFLADIESHYFDENGDLDEEALLCLLDN